MKGIADTFVRRGMGPLRRIHLVITLLARNLTLTSYRHFSFVIRVTCPSLSMIKLVPLIRHFRMNCGPQCSSTDYIQPDHRDSLRFDAYKINMIAHSYTTRSKCSAHLQPNPIVYISPITTQLQSITCITAKGQLNIRRFEPYRPIREFTTRVTVIDVVIVHRVDIALHHQCLTSRRS